MFITPNGNTLIGANITPQYEQTIKRDIEADLPREFVADVSVQKSYMDFLNGHRVLYRPFDDEGKLRSLNLSMFIIVEGSETNSEIYAQLKTRLRNTAGTVPERDEDGNAVMQTLPNGAQVPVIAHSWLRGIIESNPDSGYIRTDVLLVSDDIQKHGNVREDVAVLEQDRDPSTSSHITATLANAFLPPTPQRFVETLCANKPQWWVQRYIFGSFSYAEGLVYPNAIGCVVDPFEIPKTWKRMIAFDYGLSDPARFLFGAIDERQGIFYIYREISTEDNSVEQLAQLYFEGSRDIPSGGLWIPPLIDPKSGPKRDYNKKSLVDHFLEYGIAFQPGQISVDARVYRTNTYIESGYVKIFSCCQHLISELRDYKFPGKSLNAKRNASDKPIDKNNHSINCMEWMIMELPVNPKKILYGVYNSYGHEVSTPRETPISPWQIDMTEAQPDYDDTPLFGDNTW